jgi:DNA-directed RNA polymerase specialized sigma24 family protein
MRRVVETWAGLQVSLTDVAGIAALRDTIDGAVAANQLVKVIRAAMKWGRAHGYPSADPAAGLPPRDEGEVEGATPWPEWAYQIIVNEAPEPLRRAAFLGRAIGQRRSDLVRIGKRNRRDDGLQFRIQKLRDKPHFMPLFEHELAEIDGWPALDIGPYITLNGKAMTGDGLAAKLKAFCQAHPRLKQAEVFLHGLRALAVCDRRIDGASHQEIANQLCMSVGMVMRYSKGIDSEAASRAANVRRAANRAPKGGGGRD